MTLFSTLNVYIIFLAFICNANEINLMIRPNLETVQIPWNNNFMITCEITGVDFQDVSVNIQWFRDNLTEITDRRDLNKKLYVEKELDRPAKKLFFTGIEEIYAGLYTCTAVVEGNRQHKSILVTVFKDITFDNAPSPQFKTRGETALIECRVSGRPTPTVSWSFRGERITYSPRYSQDLYGLHVKNMTMQDEGIYVCQAAVDETGRVAYMNIEVIIYIKPEINKTSMLYEGVQSNQFTLPCFAEGHPPPRYEFTKDHSSIPLFSTSRRQFDPDAGELTFRPLTVDDAGMYTCKAYNNAGEDEHLIQLIVIEPPSIYSLTNVTGVENTSIEFVCLSYGNPAPNMTFMKYESKQPYNIGDNENGRITISTPDKGKLVMKVNSLIPDDMSNYTCSSVNKGGSHHRNGTITVYFSPRFYPDNARMVYIWPGKTRNITCHILAEPVPSVQWIKYPSIPFAIRNNETFKIHLMGKNSNLQITAREIDQNWIYGNYTCLAKNQYGENGLQINLIKANVPGPPKSAQAVNITSDTLYLVVEPPVDNGGEEVLSYRIDYEFFILQRGINEEIYIEGLRAGTTFQFRIRAVSEVGYGEPILLAVKTEEIKPPSKLILTSESFSEQPYRYTITWTKPITGGLPIRQYEFKYRKVEYEAGQLKTLEQWKIRKRDVEDTRPMTFYMLDGLEANTQYQLEVRARNERGWSDVTDPFHFHTVRDPLSDGLKDSTGNLQVHSLCLHLTIFHVFILLIFQ